MLRRIHTLPPGEDVERELRSHIELSALELEAAGWEPAAARQEAVRRFGDYETYRREAYAFAERTAQTRRRSGMLDDVSRDIVQGARGLRRTPGFTLLALLMLALGIGATTAAFSLLNGVLLRPLPYDDPHELVAIRELTDGASEIPVAYPNFLDWRERSGTLAMMAAVHSWAWTTTVLGAAEPVRVDVSRVSGNYFAVLGVRPWIGRVWSEDEWQTGGAPAVVVSHAFWTRHFGERRDLANVALNVGGISVAVMGVMPPSFRPPGGADVWAPLELLPATSYGTRTAHNFQVIARLAPGASVAQARVELNAIAQSIRETETGLTTSGVAVVPLHEHWVGGSGRALYILLGAGALVLLIACANLASAMLARSTRRAQEFAVRAALGARPARIVRQLLTESLLLAVAGAALGLGMAYAVLQLLVTIGPAAVPRLDEVRIDVRVLAFAMTLAALTTLLFASVPAWRAARVAPQGTLRQGRGSGGPARSATWSLLLAAEVAVAVVLLIGSLLLLRSFGQIVAVDPGFAVGDAVIVPLDISGERYESGEARIRYHDAVLERLAALPGVSAVAFARFLPLLGSDAHGSFAIEGTEPMAYGSYRVVSDDYFAALGVPLLAGRIFDEGDRAGAVEVAVVNRALADRFFPRGAIGHRIRTVGMDASGERWVTIVGVVENVRHRSLTQPPAAEYYLPHRQRPDGTANMMLLVRPTNRATGAFMARIRDEVRAIDANVPVTPELYRQRVGDTLSERRFTMTLLGAFAAIALLLAGIGIYGVVSYIVAQRTREVGLRKALGGSPTAITRAIFGATMIVVCGGAIVGLIIASAGTRVLDGMLFEVAPLDPLSFVLAAIVLTTVAAVAATVPVRRALAVDPMIVLKGE